jgi:hypothetical protein
MAEVTLSSKRTIVLPRKAQGDKIPLRCLLINECRLRQWSADYYIPRPPRGTLGLPAAPLSLEDARLLDYRHPREYPHLMLSLIALLGLVTTAILLHRWAILLGVVGAHGNRARRLLHRTRQSHVNRDQRLIDRADKQWLRGLAAD